MRRLLTAFLGATTVFSGLAVDPPSGLVSRSGDQSVVLHWDPVADSSLAGYRVYRALANDGPFSLRTGALLTTPGFADLLVSNGQTNYYRVTAVTTGDVESAPSATLAAVARPFANDEEFLEYVQQVHFDYFWYGANPANGLIPDRIPTPAPCSIAAVGFGLSAIGIGIDHGWITRSQGVARVRTTLNTFLQLPQGPGASGVIGYRGWFYHFLDMQTGMRYLPYNSELSSIDTALLLAGILDAKQYFARDNAEETEIRSRADAIFSRVDWNWMARGTNVLSMGWQPGVGFLSANWVGYNEAMILYCLALGADTNPLPSSAWSRWTNGYTWATHYGQSFVPFPPLFGHQYSHCWVDFRHIADGYMNNRQSTYFENSRRATLAQRAYCIANPLNRVGYSSNVWGLTACDGPWGYAARGTPPAQNDDGTIAPTAAAASIVFAPEYSLPAMRHFYRQFRRNIWTAYGFRDAFNQGEQWWGPDVLGIDQGPIVLMIENYRTQRVWRRFMRNPEVQRGLQAAGFMPLASLRPVLQPQPAQNEVSLAWNAVAGRSYQVEYSPDLNVWFGSPGPVVAQGSTAIWTDSGPPVTGVAPFDISQRFYRVFQLGWP
ncbi:MAG TPA: glucoamylase family protein [Verrucomicrobiae bacterium]